MGRSELPALNLNKQKQEKHFFPPKRTKENENI